MKNWLLGWALMISNAVSGQAQMVPEKLVYELTTSILATLRPQALTWVKRDADGKYRWRRATPNDTPAVRLLLLDRSDLRLCKGLLCAYSAQDSAQAEQELLQYFTVRDLAYMRQQLAGASQFVYQQEKLNLLWVHVVPLDTINAMRKRLGWQARIYLGNSIEQRYGNNNHHHISQMVFTKDHQQALVNVGDAYNGYSICIYRKTGVAWKVEKTVRIVEF